MARAVGADGLSGALEAAQVFDEARHAAFIALSGDSNPLHADAAGARRGYFGERVVHGRPHPPLYLPYSAILQQVVGQYLLHLLNKLPRALQLQMQFHEPGTHLQVGVMEHLHMAQVLHTQFHQVM